MKFKDMARAYLASPQYQGLALQSRRMYAKYISRLITMGGDLPVIDAPGQKDVARSRSPEKNLSGVWFDLIDSYPKATNPMKLTLRTNLSILYKWGVPNGYLSAREDFTPYIPKDPWKHEPAITNPYTLEEIQKIYVAAQLGKLPEPLKPYAYFVVFAYIMGLRPNEMYLHESEWFTKRDGDLFYQVHNAKGKGRGEIARLVAMNDMARTIINWFETQPKSHGHSRYTFRTDKGLKFLQSLVCDRVKDVCRLLGVEERGFYNTRRGLATTMAQDGRSLEHIATQLGNTPGVARRYITKDLIANARISQPKFI